MTGARRSRDEWREVWAAMVLFLQHPEIEVHNNRSELLLRGPVVGRKAWLFAGSPAGADASAIWFSLVTSCIKAKIRWSTCAR